MYWYPSPSESENQIIFSVGKELEVDALPKELGHALAKTEFVGKVAIITVVEDRCDKSLGRQKHVSF
jgi:hypothetical protein